jgi:hypothetical protein
MTKPDNSYFKEQTDLGFTQYDVDRFIIRYSKCDYPKGFISHIFSLGDGIDEGKFVNERLNAAIRAC